MAPAKKLFNKPLLKWSRIKNILVGAGLGLLCSLLGLSVHTAFFFGPVLLILWTMVKNSALVARVQRAIHAVKSPLASSVTINGRIYAGLVLVGVVAPLSACIHMLPGMKDLVSADWYYECWYNLYLVLGPYFFSLCIVVAAFLWIPPKTKRIKFSQKSLSFQLTRLLSIPAGYIIGKIVWLILCDKDEDYEALGHWSMYVGGVVIGYVIIRVLDYLVWRQEHSMNALIDSLEGLYRRVEIDFKTRDEMAAPYWKELRQFHSKY